MNNGARRRNVLLFAIMLSSAVSITQKPGFGTTYGGVFRFLDPLDKALSKYVPNETERLKELTKIQKVVNAIIPLGWAHTPDEWKLWFAVQVAYRMVASGWTLPTDELSLAFIQAMYGMAGSLNLSNPPPQTWLTKAAEAPEKLRAMGMFN